MCKMDNLGKITDIRRLIAKQILNNLGTTVSFDLAVVNQPYCHRISVNVKVKRHTLNRLEQIPITFYGFSYTAT